MYFLSILSLCFVIIIILLFLFLFLKAVDALNGKPIDKRSVAVDFSLPKDKYMEATTGVVCVCVYFYVHVCLNKKI